MLTLLLSVVEETPEARMEIMVPAAAEPVVLERLQATLLQRKHIL